MGTEKRARQKANRSAKLQAEAVQDRSDSRRRGVIGFAIVVVAVAIIAGLVYLSRGDSKSSTATESTTTSAAPATTVAAQLKETKFTYGTTACPPDGGAGKRTLTFSSPPKNCLEAGKSYTATFDTTAGQIVVDLDTTNTPGTTNNFVFLARNGYYDNTRLFRVNSGIDIIQGGSPHTQSASDPGPGYALLDEGEFTADASRGGYTYQPGDLVMARTAAPNGAGAQFFFTTGPNASGLDAQGTYVVFGHVTSGLADLQKIVATADITDPQTGEGTPKPEVTVTKVTITQK